MTERALHCDPVAAGVDQPGRVEVPEVVQADTGQPGRDLGLAPPVADGVLVRRVTGLALEHPAIGQPAAGVPLDVLAEQRHQVIGQVHHTFRSVLGRLDLDLPIAGTLDLSSHGQPAAQEVDVGEFERSGLAESKTGERADGDEGAEGVVSGVQKRTDVLGGRDGHPGLDAALAG